MSNTPSPKQLQDILTDILLDLEEGIGVSIEYYDMNDLNQPTIETLFFEQGKYFFVKRVSGGIGERWDSNMPSVLLFLAYKVLGKIRKK